MIVKNSVQCLLCGNEITSVNEKKLVECWCGNITITGGLERLTRYTDNPNSFKELSTIEENDASIQKEI